MSTGKTPHPPLSALLEKPSLRTLRAWRAQLPTESPDRLAELLADALGALNRQPDISPRTRFQLLEAVAVQVQGVLADLSGRLAGQEFPIADDARSAGERSLRLIEACVAGYRLVQAVAPSWLGRLAGDDSQRLSVERLLRLYDSYITHCRLVGVPVPEGTWSEVHRIYLQSRDRRWNTGKLPGPAREGPKRRIDHTYAQLLLTAMLPVQQLTPQTWRAVRERLPEWARLLSFGPVGGAKPGYCIRLSADSPPRPVNSEDTQDPKKHRLRIQTARLARALRRQRRRAHLPDATLALLHASWCRPPVRRHTRKEANHDGEAALGLDALHHLLTPGAEAQRPANSATPVADAGRGMVVGGRQSSHDIWKGIYGEAQHGIESPGRGGSTRTAPNRVRHALPALIDDVSASGLRLAFDLTLPLATRAGDLVGVKNRRNHWHAGVIRWLMEDGQTLRAGIELFAFECRAVSLIGRTPDEIKIPVAALAGTTRNQRHVLALPAVMSHHVESFTAIAGGQTQPVVIRKVALETPQFRLLEIEPLTLTPP